MQQMLNRHCRRNGRDGVIKLIKQDGRKEGRKEGKKINMKKTEVHSKFC